MSILNLFKKKYPGKFILILGPSGSGKGTIIDFLKSKNLNIKYPPSYTTRAKRPGEIEGDVYHYITKEQFRTKIKNREFLEWAIVHNNNYYGTDKQTIIKELENGNTVLREVDIQGVKSIYKIFHKSNIVTIFITTDSWEKLESRIKKRANISEEELANRKSSYYKEIKFMKDATHTIFSEDGKIDEANREALSIIKKYID